MSDTITGAEFRDFYDNHWPKGSWHEDAEYEIEDEEGKWLLGDDQILELSRLGYIVNPKGDRDVWTPFAEAWDAWRNEAPRLQVMTWRVPAELADDVAACMAERGIERVGAPSDAPAEGLPGPS